MNRETTCSFTGHRPEKLPWRGDESDPRCLALKERLAAAVEDAYDKGMRHFMCGMARGADFYFCDAVLELRERRMRSRPPAGASGSGSAGFPWWSGATERPCCSTTTIRAACSGATGIW